MTIPALWNKHRKIALAIAVEWRIPGLDADDVRQEALVALWEACRKYDPGRGAFPPYARMCIKARMSDLLQAATRMKRTAVFVHDVDVPARDRIEARLELIRIVAAMRELSDRERKAIQDHLDGVPATSSKSHDNALTSARRKLRREATCPRS